MSTSSSLAARALLALLLMIGFYVLAIAVALGLLFLCYLMVAHGNRINGKFLILMVVAACAILWSLLPRFDRFEPPGPELLPEDHPHLFEELEWIAGAVGQKMPAHVYLAPDVNAFVTQRGGIMGLGTRRIMGLGLPLMQCLTVTELRAVLAHEFGHYHGGDTALAPLVYQTRAAIIRTIQNIGQDHILHWPFLMYGKLFMRVTNAVSRHQEYIADSVAAQAVGSVPLVSGLKKTHAAAMAFNPFFGNEVAPALSAGYLPPCGEGFSRFLKSKAVAENVRKMIDHELEHGQSDPYDTHPALRDRIEAAGAYSPGTLYAVDPPASTLLDDLPAIEAAWLGSVLGHQKISGLKRVRWEDLADKVYFPSWEKLLRDQSAAFEGMTFGDLPTLIQSIGEFTAKLGRISHQFVSAQDAVNITTGVVGASISLHLHDSGWEFFTAPGDPFLFRLADREIEPFNLFPKLADGSMTGPQWLVLCEELGIRDMPIIETTA